MMNWQITFLFVLAMSSQILSPQALAARKKAAIAEDVKTKIRLEEGRIRFENEQFSIRLDSEYRFINARDTTRILIENWGKSAAQVAKQNPLGMIVPRQFTVRDPSWGIVITSTQDGHVEGQHAVRMDAKAILEALREEEAIERKDRQDNNNEPVEWAIEPAYDALAHTMFWAKSVSAGKNAVRNLHYSVRFLGRESVLHFDVLSTMDRLPTVTQAMQNIVAFSEFDLGSRYEDFNSKYHRSATYTRAELISSRVKVKSPILENLMGQGANRAPLFIAGLSGLALMIGRILTRRRDPEF